MMPQHLDCTTEQRREEICRTYNVNADDCIVLYGGRTVRSDANNRIIADRYYQFSCKSKVNDDAYVIVCGSGAARHLCQLINQPMPRVFNPFVEEHVGGNEGDEGDEGNEGEDERNGHGNPWNRNRRNLYYAVQLFIIRYQETISPGTAIFKISQGLCDKKYVGYPPQEFQYRKFMSIVNKYKTTIPRIIRELEGYGHIRDFDFDDIAAEADNYADEGLYNIFRDRDDEEQ